MKGSIVRVLLLFAVCLAFAAPQALSQTQTIFRCVGADGKISYADRPCEGKVAASKEIDVRANLDDIARAKRKQENDLQRERERHARSGAANPSPKDEGQLNKGGTARKPSE